MRVRVSPNGLRRLWPMLLFGRKRSHRPVETPAWLELDRVRAVLTGIILVCLLALILVSGRTPPWWQSLSTYEPAKSPLISEPRDAAP